MSTWLGKKVNQAKCAVNFKTQNIKDSNKKFKRQDNGVRHVLAWLMKGKTAEEEHGKIKST